MAALYLDGGVDVAGAFVERTLIPKMSLSLAREPDNPKSALQEKLQEGGITPTYRLVETQGPPHDRTFVAQVYAGDKGLAQGVGRTNNEAESQAAKSTLARLSEFFGIGLTGEQLAERAEKAAAEKAISHRGEGVLLTSSRLIVSSWIEKKTILMILQIELEQMTFNMTLIV